MSPARFHCATALTVLILFNSVVVNHIEKDIHVKIVRGKVLQLTPPPLDDRSDSTKDILPDRISIVLIIACLIVYFSKIHIDVG